MAKQPKEQVQTYSNKEVKVEVGKTFIYEVQEFVSQLGFYSLRDTKHINSKEPLSKLTVYSKQKNGFIIEYFKLLVAPVTWLKQNKFVKDE